MYLRGQPTVRSFIVHGNHAEAWREDEATDGGGDQVRHSRAKFRDTAKRVTDHGPTVAGPVWAGCSILNIPRVFGCFGCCLEGGRWI